jgi:hypothetical protein
MKATLPVKIAFWAAICVSSGWLLLTAALGARMVQREIANGFRLVGNPLEVLIVLAFALQPFLILFLIIRAIRRRGDGQPLWIVMRALYPLILIPLVAVYLPALNYLLEQSELRRYVSWHSGTMTYVCSPHGPAVSQDPNYAWAVHLHLTVHRHPGQLGTWSLVWLGKKPVQATSFRARTGSFGGSQGIRWRDPDGQPKAAYLSFSDVMTDHGSAEIYVARAPVDAGGKTSEPEAMLPIDLICVADLASYRE